jgi:multicomponent Na+:H+ antiporter subunit A
MAIAVLLAFVVAFVAPYVHRFAGDRSGWLLAIAPAGLFVWFLAQIPAVTEAGAVYETIPWVPSLGVTFGFALDGLALLFALLITGLGALITVYAGSYLAGDPLRGRFFLYLLVFMGSMLGVVLADDIIALFVFWELTSFASYLLIGYKHEYEKSRKAALQALLVTGTGGLALLAGLLLLSIAAGGSFSLAEIATQKDVVLSHSLYLPAFILIVAGCFTKSAQVPFHFWLPNAMAAPTPVSAYLHSATMVKAGIYLLARLYETMAGTDAWLYTLTVFGAATMVTGAVLALRHSDLKKVLAYSTVTALGTLVMLLGLSFVLAVKAAMIFLLVHALYKGALFLVAGSMGHESGTLDVLDLRGLRGKMPWTYATGLLAAASMAGLPPLFGFIGKETVYDSALDFEGGALAIVIAAVFANVLTVVAAGIVTLRPFLGDETPIASRAHEAPPAMLLGPALLAVIGLVLGIIPWFMGLIPVGPDTLIGPAVSAVLGVDTTIVTQAWHGFNTALILSIITVGLGVVGYLKWDAIRAFLVGMDPVLTRGPERAYELTFDGMLSLADWQTRTIQNGNLRHYLLALVVLAFGLFAFTYVVKVGSWPGISFEGARFEDVVVVALAMSGAIIAAAARSRILAIAGLGTSGFGIALLFITFGAPDLAMTQLLVETLIVIVILLVMRRLPAFGREGASRVGNARDIAVAAGVGLVVTVAVLAILQTPFDTTLSEYFARESAPAAYGRNIVNVILVDFRALDTLGEITVLAVAALGALALLRTRPGQRRDQTDEAAP